MIAGTTHPGKYERPIRDVTLGEFRDLASSLVARLWLACVASRELTQRAAEHALATRGLKRRRRLLLAAGPRRAIVRGERAEKRQAGPPGVLAGAVIRLLGPQLGVALAPCSAAACPPRLRRRSAFVIRLSIVSRRRGFLRQPSPAMFQISSSAGASGEIPSQTARCAKECYNLSLTRRDGARRRRLHAGHAVSPPSLSLTCVPRPSPGALSSERVCAAVVLLFAHTYLYVARRDPSNRTLAPDARPDRGRASPDSTPPLYLHHRRERNTQSHTPSRVL